MIGVKPRIEAARQDRLRASSKPDRLIRTARTRSWPGSAAHPQRCIIHRKDGLTQVIRLRLKGGTNRPAATAAPAMAGP